MLAYLMILQLVFAGCDGFRESTAVVPKECKVYDTAAGGRLARVCEDCYNLYHENAIYKGCMNNCYNNDYFGPCVEVLMIEGSEKEDLQRKIVELNGGIPDGKIALLRAPDKPDALSSCNNYRRQVYDKLELTCENCQKKREGAEILNNCRSNCFVNPFFAGCIKAFESNEKGGLEFLRNYINGVYVKSNKTKAHL